MDEVQKPISSQLLKTGLNFEWNLSVGYHFLILFFPIIALICSIFQLFSYRALAIDDRALAIDDFILASFFGFIYKWTIGVMS
jgi:hypothetical protein